MAFDDELRRAFDTLTDRFHDDVARSVRGVTDALEARARDEHARALAAATEAARADAEAQAARIASLEQALDAATRAEREARERVAAAIAEADARLAAAVADAEARVRADAEQQTRQAIDAVMARPSAAAAPAVDDEALAHEMDAMRALDQCRTLTDVLDTITEWAARETGRAALMLVRDGAFHAWRLMGFGSLDLDPTVSLPWPDSSIVGEAGHTKATARGGADVAPAFAALGDEGDCLAVPILLAGDPVAILYVDNGAMGTSANSVPRSWRERVEAVARYGGRAVHALTAYKAAQMMAAAPPVPVAPPARFDEHDLRVLDIP